MSKSPVAVAAARLFKERPAAMLKQFSQDLDVYARWAKGAVARRTWGRSTTKVLALLRDKSAAIVGVTSDSNGTGVSTFAAALAEAYVSISGRVLLLDASRLPRRVATAGRESGDLLDGLDITSSLRRVDGVSMLDLGTVPGLVGANDDTIRKVVASIAGKFDMVIVDLPPAARGTDGLVAGGFAAATACDVVLMLCVTGKPTNLQLEELLQLCSI